MARFLRSLMLYMLFLLPFYMISTFFWELFVDHPYKPNLVIKPHEGFLSNRLLDLRNTSDVDILFLGSSKAYRGFDNRIFYRSNYKTFNLGSSAQTHIQTNFLLKEHLSQLNPKFIVYEVYPDTFIGDGVESAVNIISSPTSINFNSLRFVWDMNNVKVYNTFLNTITRKIFNIEQKLSYIEGADKYIKGGFVEHISEQDTIIYLPKEKWIPNEKQIEKFDENLNLIRKHNIPYILVLTPYTKKYENLNEIEIFYRTRGEFINFNKTLNFTIKEHFYDGQHLNQKAVTELNSELIKIIKPRFKLN
jgi:hypothetical protein